MKINSSGFTIKNSKFNNNTYTGLTTTINGTVINILNSEFNNNNIGLDASGENLYASGSKFSNNKNYGIKTNNITNCTVNNSDINSNLYNVYTSSVSTFADPSSTVLDFTGNNWSNYTEDFINQKIYDNDDNTNCPKVNFASWTREEFEKAEIDQIFNQNNKAFTPLTAAETKSITFNTACAANTNFLIGVYDTNGALLSTYTYTTQYENETVTINIPENDTTFTSGKIAKIKVFAWDTASLTPQMKAVEIN